ncbi:MAG: hypothetical protein IPJ30_23845 [Acidobacteria bacterium]|nr:hypothetical protein [Acidobacteriota bacterium]
MSVFLTLCKISQLKTATNANGTVSFNYDNRNRLLNTTDVFGHTVGYNPRLQFDGKPALIRLDGSVRAV